MKQGTGRRMIGAFLRSLFIHSTWNFWRMQNLGFAFAMIPTIRFLGGNLENRSRMLARHLQLFNTNPYMSGPIIGATMKLEEDSFSDGNCPEVDQLKTTLMAPYAAIGDSFFWGALKPLAAAVGVLLAMKGFFCACLVALLIYNPIHLWIRLKGFMEGYRKGKDGIEFIRAMNLPRISRRIRWLSVTILSVLALAVSDAAVFPGACIFETFKKGALLLVILLCFWMLKRGISVLGIFYGASLLLFLVIGLK
jgi:PTS system mannose-specific IID component